MEIYALTGSCMDAPMRARVFEAGRGVIGCGHVSGLLCGLF